MLEMHQTNEDKIKTNTLGSMAFFFNRAVYKIMWENIGDPERPHMTA